MTSTTSFDDFVLAALVRGDSQMTTATQESLDRWQISKWMLLDIVTNHNSQLDYFTFLEQIKARHPGKHLVVMHGDIYFSEDFLHRLLEQIALIEGAGVAWGVLGPAGVTYPYFKIVRNMVDYHGILYPFAQPLPAVHLDGHLLVIHKDLCFNFDPSYRGFHHYDTLLCIRSWAQGLPVFTINLPLRHLGKGNVPEWEERSATLGQVLGEIYGNKTIMTSMGPIALNAEPGTTRDFYKHDVEPTLSRRFGHRAAPDLVFILRIDSDDKAAARETLLSVCGQFEKPSRVLVLCPNRLRATLEEVLRYFGNFVDLVVVSPEHDTSLSAGDVLMGCGNSIRGALPERAVVAFLNCGTILFPNYVRDIRRFHVWGIGVSRVIAALDFDYAVRESQNDRGTINGDEQLIPSWKTEAADDLVSGGVIPLVSLAMPADVVRSVIDDHLYGALTERIFTLKLVARAPVFFLRRLGGVLRRTPEELRAADNFDEIADQSEFLRTAYPFTPLWMKQRSPVSGGATPHVQSSPAIAHSREQLLVLKLSRCPKLIDGIFKLHGVIKQLRKWSAERPSS
ncbi:hypothetical protein Nham_2766 [Nitrobacter hamburgensis X14]|uniref:Uncharacterized protein n=1 Tax=Nitrobacter hamburgensis (strain DSM 10229 / NCIMB 13809 / X14) TaxID=323097 RepID=Q1QJQ3_NITHX|nr:hypothetical protein [Nitrobacter hamburgensis]ABE63544.1 hypothetical protein Nham_2766 [Nitrobacter hamburgensis X14]